MGSSDGEGLSQLYLELVDAYKERFMPQNGKVVVLKYSPVWKKMRKVFKHYLNLNSSSSTKLGNVETMAHKTPLKDSSLKIKILTRLVFFFFFKPENLVSLLKNMDGCVMDGCVSLEFFFNFIKEK